MLSKSFVDHDFSWMEPKRCQENPTEQETLSGINQNHFIGDKHMTEIKTVWSLLINCVNKQVNQHPEIRNVHPYYFHCHWESMFMFMTVWEKNKYGSCAKVARKQTILSKKNLQHKLVCKIAPEQKFLEQ